ncbi:MAG: ribosome biogenesis GTPase YlqF [Candidatus Faecousia sp.]|nr:ribosome biogenesis GTPase YlqF [Candidatus Faecousia sp.]
MDNQDQMNIQWYPGHMTKTRRQIEADLKQVDAVCEIVDARIPVSSRNPDIDSICAGKPRILVLNRMDLADPAATQKWAAFFKEKGMAVIATDCKTRKGIADFTPAAKKACAQKLERDAARGMSRPIRVMVVGIPNVGKSTLINQISGRKGAKAENRPGVTRGKQWVTVDRSLQLLDTPGILWPKFEDPEVGLKLAYTGAVKEGVIDLEELACALMELLHRYYPDALSERYKVQAEPGTPGYQLLEIAGKNRGFLLPGGKIHTERMAKVLVDEFRSGKLGRFTLEMPEEIQ